MTVLTVVQEDVLVIRGFEKLPLLSSSSPSSSSFRLFVDVGATNGFEVVKVVKMVFPSESVVMIGISVAIGITKIVEIVVWLPSEFVVVITVGMLVTIVDRGPADGIGISLSTAEGIPSIFSP